MLLKPRTDILAGWPVALLAALVSICWTGSARAQGEQKQVLVLFSTGRDSQIAILGERELPRMLDRGLARNLDYYSEYIDAGRFPDPSYQAAFRDFLRLKYRGRTFDVVIAMLDVAAEFLDKNRDELFPGTPVVTFSSNSVSLQHRANAVAVFEQMNYEETLALATRLQPDTKEVFVVTGAGPRDKVYENRVRTLFRSHEPRLSFTYLSGLPTNELEQRLKALPEHSIVYYLLVYEDGNGRLFQPLDYLDGLAAIANRPIYSWVDSTMGRGIVGGSMRPLQEQITVVSNAALRVLRGESADSIPTPSIGVQVDQVDWRQLRRWNISEANVPAAATVLFREETAWDRFKVYILGTLALVLAQMALIAGLLLQSAKRRQSEDRERASQADLRRSFERIRDLGARLLGAQEAERSRIARELHDDVGQQIALLAIDLELLNGAGYVRPSHLPGRAVEALNRVRSVARSVHDLSHRLHPDKLRLIGLVPALRSLEREFSQSGMAVVFTHDNVPSGISYDVALCLFRIVQEALRNVVNHSGARNVSVHLNDENAQLALTIVDDGTGFDVDAAVGRGIGLISMAERLEPLGGAIRIYSQVGAGTRLEISVPLRDAQVAKQPPPASAGRDVVSSV